MGKVTSVIFLACLAFANAMPQHFPWMNSYVACIARMPMYNYQPTVLERGTFRVEADTTEFSNGQMITFYVDGKNPDDKFRGLFISILGNGKSVGEWMPDESFMLRSCDGAENSAMTETDTTEKRFREHALRWKAPDCNEDMNYEVRATVIKGENEFEREISVPLRCVQQTENIYYDMYDYYDGGDSSQTQGKKDTSAEKPEPEKPMKDGYDVSNQKSDPEGIPKDTPTSKSVDKPASPEQPPVPEGNAKPAPENIAAVPEGMNAGNQLTPPTFVLFQNLVAEPAPENGNNWEEGRDGDYEKKDEEKGTGEPVPENLPPMNPMLGGTPENTPTPEKNLEETNEDYEKKPEERGTGEPVPRNPVMGGTPENTPTPEKNWKETDEDYEKKDKGKGTGEPVPENLPPMNPMAGGTPENTPTPEKNWEEKDEDYEKKSEEKGTGEPVPMTPVMGGTPENTPAPEKNWKETDEDYKKDKENGTGEPVPENLPATNPMFGGTPENRPTPEKNWEETDENYEKKVEEKGTGEPVPENLTPIKPMFGGTPENTPTPEKKWEKTDENYEKKVEEKGTGEPVPMSPVFGGTPENAPTPEKNREDMDEDYEKKNEEKGTGEPVPENLPPINSMFGGTPEKTPTPKKNWEKTDEDYEKKDEEKGTGKPVPRNLPPKNPMFGGSPENTPTPENNWENENKIKPNPEDKSSTPPMLSFLGGKPEGEPVPAPEKMPATKPEGSKDDSYGKEDLEEKAQIKSTPEPKSGDDTYGSKNTTPAQTTEKPFELEEQEEFYYDNMYYYPDETNNAGEADEKENTETEPQDRKPMPEVSPGDETKKTDSMMKPNPEGTNDKGHAEEGDEVKSSPEPKSGDDVYGRNNSDIESDMMKATPEPMPGNKDVTTKPMPEGMDRSSTYEDNTNDERAPPPLPESRPKPLGLGMNKCKNRMYNVPQGSTTSFERYKYGAWKNDTAGELMWLPKMGKTPSPGTGPNRAFNGQNYLYMEGSRPGKAGDQAILSGPRGLRGCFCIQFACHAMVDPQTTIEVRVNGVTVNKNGFSHVGWQVMTTTVDNEEESKIEIIATKGPTFRSDVAIDDIRITPGMCAEDM